MCGRFAFFAPPQKLRDLLGLDNMIALAPRYNSAPMQDLPIVVRDRIGLARWGFGDRYINARIETVADKPAFREAWARGSRCVVPASGWYEWQGGRQPYFIRPRDAEIVLLAGIWERYEGGVRFAILTRASEGALAGLHPRMPVVIAPDAVGNWFAAAPVNALSDGNFTFHPVSPDIGKVANDEHSLVEKWSVETASFRLVS